MTRPLVPVPGALITAAPDGSPDPFLSAIVARYVADVAAAAAHDAAVRSGAIPPPPPARNWVISDRD